MDSEKTSPRRSAERREPKGAREHGVSSRPQQPDEPVGEPIRMEVAELNMYYGTFKALSGVSMKIAENKVTALIGPSGCGKSTFIRSLNRMHEVVPGARVEGKVTLDGENIYAA